MLGPALAEQTLIQYVWRLKTAFQRIGVEIAKVVLEAVVVVRISKHLLGGLVSVIGS